MRAAGRGGSPGRAGSAVLPVDDGPELPLDDALTGYARPGARACGECAAAEVLDRL